MRKTSRSPLGLMALTILIDFTGFGLILPLLPFWAQRLGANTVGVGLIITMYALAQFLFTPVLGALSDRYGRKPIIITSLCIEALSLVLTALASSLPLLLLARFVSGLGASNMGSAQAVVSDVTTKQERARGMGVIGAATGLGFVIGPALGGILSPHGETLPFWITAAAAFVNALLVLFFLPETRRTQSEIEGTPTRSGNRFTILLAGWRHVRHAPTILALIGVNLLYTTAFTAMETVLPLFTQHYFGWQSMQNGYIFAYIGVIAIIMQGGLVRRLVKLWNERTLLLGGLICFALGLFFLALSTQLIWLFLSLGVLSIGESAVMPTLSTLVTFVSPENAQGETLGLSQSMGGIARIFGPLIASSTFAQVGPGAPLLIGGVIVALMAGLAAPILRTVGGPSQAYATEAKGRSVSRVEKS
jgi:DHA1 family tetracycline resistance protein-like MFS transporter